MNRDSTRIYDELLVASSATGDRRALALLVARWHPRLYRFAWRVLRDPERAKDATQEAWVEILRNLRGMDDFAAFPAWAFRIVLRRCQRAFAQAPAPSSIDADEVADADATREAETTAEVAIVLRAIAALPPAQRAAIALFYGEGLGVGEIAIACDIPPGTVKTRLMHARQKVRAILEGKPDGQD